MPQTIIEVLYQYIEENRLAYALPRFPQSARKASAEMEQLEAMLKGEAAQLFQQYQDHETQARMERDLALVRCGVSTGMELGRL